MEIEMIIHKKFVLIFSSLILSGMFANQISAQQSDDKKILNVTLEQCIELTLKNNNTRASFGYAEKIAEAKVKQAHSGYYPSLDVNAIFTHSDEDPNYIVPAFKIQIPAMNLGNLSTPAMTFPVPEQNIKLADKQNLLTDVNLVYPIYAGGKITSYVEQAEAGLEIAKQDLRENDQQIIYQTKKLFYASLLASKLEEIAQDAYDRFTTTLKFTENAYQNGGRVTKTDYLKNKTITEAVKSILLQISGEKKNALAALAFAMGFDWHTEIKIDANEFPNNIMASSLDDLIDIALNNNPNIFKIDNGIKAFNSKIDQAESDFYPTVALFGNYRRIFNAYDSGFMTKENKNVWTLGVGLQLNIFNGFRTSGLIDEAKAGKDQLNEQKKLLTKGLSLKVQYLYNQIQTAAEKEKSSAEAVKSASENCELIEKAYFNDIMDLADLIEAQLTESMMKAQYSSILFEKVNAEAELQMVLSNINN
jgi:outer membrane protein TolC